MHPALILALASFTSARNLRPRGLGLSPRDITVPVTPAGGLPATAKPAVASVLGDDGSKGEGGIGNWTGACTQAIGDFCKKPDNLGTLEKWVWSLNTNTPTCMVGLWQPSPSPADPNLPKGVEPLTQDKCSLYFTQMQTTLQAIIKENPSVDRGSVNIVDFPNGSGGSAYSAGSQVDSTRPSFIMQPLRTVPDQVADQGTGSGPGTGTGSGNGDISGGSRGPISSKCGPNGPARTVLSRLICDSDHSNCLGGDVVRDPPLPLVLYYSNIRIDDAEQPDRKR